MVRDPQTSFQVAWPVNKALNAEARKNDSFIPHSIHTRNPWLPLTGDWLGALGCEVKARSRNGSAPLQFRQSAGCVYAGMSAEATGGHKCPEHRQLHHRAAGWVNWSR